MSYPWFSLHFLKKGYLTLDLFCGMSPESFVSSCGNCIRVCPIVLLGAMRVHPWNYSYPER